MIGLPNSTFLELAIATERMFYDSRKRDPLPKISIRDALFLLLCTYRSGEILDKLSAMFRFKKSTLYDCLVRARNLLILVLHERWNTPSPPQLFEGVYSSLQKVGLIVDCNSCSSLLPFWRLWAKSGEIEGYFSVLADRIYIREISNFHFEKITRLKTNNIGYSPTDNLRISRLRVHVERLFGRMKKIWKIGGTRYRFDHSHFDADIDNCVANK